MREKIRLNSSAGTGIFIPQIKTNEPCLEKWRSKNLIPWFEGM